jgi:hypothetical protein
MTVSYRHTIRQNVLVHVFIIRTKTIKQTKTMTYVDGNPGLGFVQAQKCGDVKLVRSSVFNNIDVVSY